MKKLLAVLLFWTFALALVLAPAVFGPLNSTQPTLSVMNLLPFFVSSLMVGFVVVFVVPFIKSNLETIPQLAALTSNRFVQLIFVGAIAMVGLGIFGGLARRFR